MLNKKDKLINICIYVLFTIALIFVVSQKQSYHIDGFYSYNLANTNHSISIDLNENTRYEPAELPFNEYLTVDDNATFDYVNVWQRQAGDVHPPLYYVLLHTISSLFPNTFSKWYSCSINIVALLITLFFVQKIIKQLTDNKYIYYLTTLSFALTTGILDSVALCRMYVLAMMWTTIGTYLYLRQLEKHDGLKFYIEIALITYLGAMTHYYVIVYFVLIAIVYGIYLLIIKKYNDVGIFCGSMAIAGVCSVLTFPAMIDHIFSGYRGTEAVDNLLDISTYMKRLTSFFSNISNELFGNEMLYVLLGLIVLLGIRILKNKYLDSLRAQRYVFLIVPTAIYFILVSKIAAYINERYISIIYPIIIVWIYSLLFDTINEIVSSKYSKYVSSALLVILLVLGFYHAEWTYLYRDTKPLNEASIKYQNLDCICIYDGNQTDVLNNCVELMNYNSLTLIKEEDISNINKYIETDEVVIKILNIENEEECLSNIKQELSNLSNCDLLGNARNGSSYHLY